MLELSECEIDHAWKDRRRSGPGETLERDVLRRKVLLELLGLLLVGESANVLLPHVRHRTERPRERKAQECPRVTHLNPAEKLFFPRLKRECAKLNKHSGGRVGHPQGHGANVRVLNHAAGPQIETGGKACPRLRIGPIVEVESLESAPKHPGLARRVLFHLFDDPVPHGRVQPDVGKATGRQWATRHGKIEHLLRRRGAGHSLLHGRNRDKSRDLPGQLFSATGQRLEFYASGKLFDSELVVKPCRHLVSDTFGSGGDEFLHLCKKLVGHCPVLSTLPDLPERRHLLHDGLKANLANQLAKLNGLRDTERARTTDEVVSPHKPRHVRENPGLVERDSDRGLAESDQPIHVTLARAAIGQNALGFVLPDDVVLKLIEILERGGPGRVNLQTHRTENLRFGRGAKGLAGVLVEHRLGVGLHELMEPQVFPLSVCPSPADPDERVKVGAALRAWGEPGVLGLEEVGDAFCVRVGQSGRVPLEHGLQRLGVTHEELEFVQIAEMPKVQNPVKETWGDTRRVRRVPSALDHASLVELGDLSVAPILDRLVHGAKVVHVRVVVGIGRHVLEPGHSVPLHHVKQFGVLLAVKVRHGLDLGRHGSNLGTLELPRKSILELDTGVKAFPHGNAVALQIRLQVLLGLAFNLGHVRSVFTRHPRGCRIRGRFSALAGQRILCVDTRGHADFGNRRASKPARHAPATWSESTQAVSRLGDEVSHLADDGGERAARGRELSPGSHGTARRRRNVDALC